ncbi:clathrin adaptor complex small chain family protein [Cryptosporidium muris RN66]|uniref:AP complex subunit sigma n=2 Tax=Cryptosporidium TaxID=5806 RepID=B6AHE2_CRYMR|nr:clathrin adaptor complex small chain family protein [Cryptosporidium muris RN66]EEA07637.1 clathrin adaptor complex small chain family protein [Cryptosporidium muris RN66]OII75150.1 clathrin adaptor complex small chain family protein [Cryptosporidium andersoni]|eukprot:XP_002141986.1 clathrin adaptor complex small chain family protein [Cryptosporidium muris RN66]
MFQFFLLISRQGKVRLEKWYNSSSQNERKKLIKEITYVVLNRQGKLCNFIEWRDYTLVAKRYASLYFIACIEKVDNELLALEIIHHFVEVLDRYFGNVCELDLIFNFHKAYFILDEVILSGEIEESSKKAALRIMSTQDSLMEESRDTTSSLAMSAVTAAKKAGALF